jgi:anti-anti-sigma factor
MAFTATLETPSEAIAKITLVGELDASTAPDFKSEVEKAVSSPVKRLVLDLSDLEYMASAGLRVLIYAKQKIGMDTDLYVVNPQEAVLHTLTVTGFDQSVFIVPSEAEIPT